MRDPGRLNGRTLGARYQLGDPIGSGAMGCTYRARSLLLDAPVAVKVLHAELAADPSWTKRFCDEAHLAAQISHPNVVKMIDFGRTADGLVFQVMELVPGRTLADLLHAQGALPVGRALVVARQLVAALEELHAQGIAHGDVKSHNAVLCSARDGSDWLKLIDFGLASRLAGAGGVDGRGRGFGTPGYVAPEVILGGAIGTAADVYAAGVVLYELLTALLPFGGGSPSQILDNQLAAVFIAPSAQALRTEIPAAVEALIARTLARKPDERPDATTLRRALASLALPEPLAPPRSGRAAAREPGRARGAGAPSASGGRVDRLRCAIGRAMRGGDVDHLGDLYLCLGRLLRDLGDSRAAEAELAEAVAVVTAGPATGSGPDSVWRLLLLLAELQTLGGRLAAARASVARAYRHAEGSGSGLGRSSAERQARAAGWIR
jgi:serine/threonine-protein kinase